MIHNIATALISYLISLLHLNAFCNLISYLTYVVMSIMQLVEIIIRLL